MFHLSSIPLTTLIQPVVPAEDEGSQTSQEGSLRSCALSSSALITSEISWSNPFPVLCIAGKEKAACPLFSLPVAWCLANHKSPAIGNTAACSLIPTQQEGSHGSFYPLCQCLAERWMKSIFSLPLSPFNKTWWKQIKDLIERSQNLFFHVIFDDWIDEATAWQFDFFFWNSLDFMLRDIIALLKTSFSRRKSRQCFIHSFQEFRFR